MAPHDLDELGQPRALTDLRLVVGGGHHALQPSSCRGRQPSRNRSMPREMRSRAASSYAGGDSPSAARRMGATTTSVTNCSAANTGSASDSSPFASAWARIDATHWTARW
ncbi:hypothetical protein WR25_12128 [Diploscapter pachys]|uniref:Uncharacterized protein n=1 Tax=Diploscapter pachys TaxID=2018661 RepID=A0A2A2JXS9_9BILA|nr:hypothetical protein WR25_12128 [Diploscapter pachys]